MKPAPFRYYAPHTLAECLSLLAEHGYDAKLLAGGQSLVPTMNFRLAQPAILVDLNQIAELAYITPEEGHGLQIGAMTRQRAAERSQLVEQHAPLLHMTMPLIAHTQIRNRGTIGGSLAHADPAAELPAVAVVADAQLLSPRTGWAIQEVARRHGDYAMVGVTARVTLDEEGRCQSAKIALISVGEGPVLALNAATLLQGEIPNEALIADAAHTVAHVDIDPMADIHASVAYRRHLAQILTQRVLTQAFAQAEGV